MCGQESWTKIIIEQTGSKLRSSLCTLQLDFLASSTLYYTRPYFGLLSCGEASRDKPAQYTSMRARVAIRLIWSHYRDSIMFPPPITHTHTSFMHTRKIIWGNYVYYGRLQFGVTVDGREKCGRQFRPICCFIHNRLDP